MLLRRFLRIDRTDSGQGDTIAAEGRMDSGAGPALSEGRRNEAIERLYRAYGRSLVAFCYRLCGSLADAEDLAMEAFAAAAGSYSRFQGRSTAKTWLYRIALYKWREMRAARRLACESLEGVETPGPQGDPELAMVLDEAIQSLPETLYEAFVLVKVEDLAYREAADVLGVPTGTVQSRVHAAVQHLRRKMGPTMGRPFEGGEPA